MSQTTELERLKVALTLVLSRRLIQADNKVLKSEVAWWQQRFPVSQLQQMGFVGEDHAFTDALADAAARATELLPGALTVAEKLDLLTTLFESARADGEVAPEEMIEMEKAAALLGINRAALWDHLGQER